ncbi:hypothetical protein BH11PSE5_BH11PSE5_08510 [soil metagenome]|uniref:Uncharacterized protein n=2 Tax=Sphingomonas echinoides TaxID=59803 RepID=A0ABU4PQF8_9SPHN|nr:hypothetical protein [Sphingomonas echinoides]MDX5986381.1 hypothetical protein [Sphingomonas echinoides]
MVDFDFLIEKVTQNWSERRVLLMAQVKPLLVRNGVDLDATLDGRQIKAWLESDVPDIKLIKNEREPTNWGLVPADADVSEPYSQYFVTGRTPSSKIKRAFPFQNALRIAFTRPIEPGQKRWLFAGPARYLDLPVTDKPEGGVELTSSVIEPGANDERIITLIEHWLVQNGLSNNHFLYERPSMAHKSRAGRSALHQLLDIIPIEDLERVSLPLDIIRKLLDKSEDSRR